MTALGIEMTTRDVDKFYWPKHSFHGKPLDLLEVESEISRLEARYIRLTDRDPLPWAELEETEDTIKRLEKEKGRLWNEWQLSISQMRKEQARQ